MRAPRISRVFAYFTRTSHTCFVICFYAGRRQCVRRQSVAARRQCVRCLQRLRCRGLTLQGCGAALGWAAALCAGKAGAPGIPRVSMRHMLWLPALSALAPVSCAYCYSQLEGTVVDARALRGHMYEHKRA